MSGKRESNMVAGGLEGSYRELAKFNAKLKQTYEELQELKEEVKRLEE